MTDEQRTIGRLEAHVDDLRSEMQGMRKDVADIKDLVQQGKGARMALAGMATVFGGLAGFLASIFSVARGS